MMLMTNDAVRAQFLWKAALVVKGTTPSGGTQHYCMCANAIGGVECEKGEYGAQRLCKLHKTCYYNFLLPDGRCKFIGCTAINTNATMHSKRNGLCKSHFDLIEIVQPILATIPFPTLPGNNASSLDIYQYNKASNHGKITMTYVKALVADHLTQNGINIPTDNERINIGMPDSLVSALGKAEDGWSIEIYKSSDTRSTARYFFICIFIPERYRCLHKDFEKFNEQSSRVQFEEFINNDLPTVLEVEDSWGAMPLTPTAIKFFIKNEDVYNDVQTDQHIHGLPLPAEMMPYCDSGNENEWTFSVVRYVDVTVGHSTSTKFHLPSGMILPNDIKKDPNGLICNQTIYRKEHLIEALEKMCRPFVPDDFDENVISAEEIREDKDVLLQLRWEVFRKVNANNELVSKFEHSVDEYTVADNAKQNDIVSDIRKGLVGEGWRVLIEVFDEEDSDEEKEDSGDEEKSTGSGEKGGSEEEDSVEESGEEEGGDGDDGEDEEEGSGELEFMNVLRNEGMFSTIGHKIFKHLGCKRKYAETTEDKWKEHEEEASKVADLLACQCTFDTHLGARAVAVSGKNNTKEAYKDLLLRHYKYVGTYRQA